MESVILFIVILLIPCIAYSVISLTYNKYKENNLKSKLSGFEVARKILDDNDLKDMYIVEVKGSMNDHYDYNQKVIRLSTDVYNGENVSSMVVASRICGYAILDKNNNGYMRFSYTINPLVVFINYIAYLLFIVGICLQDFQVIQVSALLLGSVLVLRLIMLPMEFSACKEARKALEDIKKIEKNELEDSENVFRVFPYNGLMAILTCISNLFSEIIYNLQRRG